MNVSTGSSRPRLLCRAVEDRDAHWNKGPSKALEAGWSYGAFGCCLRYGAFG